MKFFVLLLLFGVVLAAPKRFDKNLFKKSIERGLSDAANEILENFRQLMLNGNEEEGVPVMDPWTFENIGLDVDTKVLTLHVKAQDAYMKGLASFKVNNVDMSQSPLEITFDGNLPMTIIHAEKYNLRGLVFGALPIYGNGVAHFEIGNFQFTGTSGVAEGPNGVYLTDIHLVMNLETFKSETTGMLGGGDIDDVINQIMADVAPDFFNSNSDLISDMISDTILGTINQVLDGLSLDDLIKIIG